jgi:hypothetical protein
MCCVHAHTIYVKGGGKGRPAHCCIIMPTRTCHKTVYACLCAKNRSALTFMWVQMLEREMCDAYKNAKK